MPGKQKLSVSLPTSLVRFLERYQRDHALKTKSSVLARALEVLRETELERAYVEAAQEERQSGEVDAWEGTAGDGSADEEWP